MASLYFICFHIMFYILSQSQIQNAQTPPPLFACDIVNNQELANLIFCDKSLDMKTRVDDLVKRLTLQEKIGFLVSSSEGVNRVGIPKYEWWSEALHGVSNVGPGVTFTTTIVPGATCFPQVILTAASHNKTLFETIGKVVSTEGRAMHNVGLGGLTFWSPNVNIFRDPRWGRGQETPGEDPMLTSTYGAEYVKGLQQRDDGDEDRLKVAACCKHYTAYDLDSWKGIERFTFNAVVNQQDLGDTFQPPFKSCVVDGNVASVMCSYNQVNGKPTCGDPDLLQSVIRGEWKLNGYIVSDCDSVGVLVNDQQYTKTPEEGVALAIRSGLDLNCGTFLKKYTEAAVKQGLLNESDVDRAISNNFATLMRLGFFDGDPRKQLYGDLGPKDVCTPEHQELAREAARQGIVLLKNTGGSLPLSPTSIKSLAVIGPNANNTDTQVGNYQGYPCKNVTALQALTASVPTLFLPGCDDVACSTAHVEDAKRVAAMADAVVLVMGSDQSIEKESLDRVNITLPGEQELLVSEVAEVSKGPVILVIMSGGGMDVQFAKNNPKVTSILWIGFPGEKGGAALADVIFGYYNPGGRLPMTWYPQSYVENVPMTNMNMRPDPNTGYPGRTYRFYTGPTVYSFGYGLSYSKYSHRLLQSPPEHVTIPLDKEHDCRSSTCISIDVLEQKYKNLGFEIHLSVKNRGKLAGSHSVLLFSTPPSVHNAPQKQLVDFEKVYLTPQAEELVRFNVDIYKHLSIVDEQGNRKVALGTYVLHIGSLKHSLNVRI